MELTAFELTLCINLSILYLAIDISRDLIVNANSSSPVTKYCNANAFGRIFGFVDYPRLSSELVRSCSKFSDILALFGEKISRIWFKNEIGRYKLLSTQ